MPINSVNPAAAVQTSTSVSSSQNPSSDVISQRRALTGAIAQVNASGILGPDNRLTYVVDRLSHQTVAQIVNRETNEVVLQVPAEYILRLAAELSKFP